MKLGKGMRDKGIIMRLQYMDNCHLLSLNF